MKTMKLIAILTVLAVVTGCNSIPNLTKNAMSFSTSTGQAFDATGHKDTTIKGIEVRMTDGTVVKMAEYQSVANAAAVAEAGAVDRNNQAMMKLVTEAIIAIGKTAATP